VKEEKGCSSNELLGAPNAVDAIDRARCLCAYPNGLDSAH
jgi:hypothetical protein